MADPQGASISVSPITAEDLVRNESVRVAELQRFMQGGTTFGAPTRAEQIGMTSHSPEQEIFRPSVPTLEEQIAAGTLALDNLTQEQAPPNVDPDDDVAVWKKKYGDRENEFGDLRRKSQELEETLNLLLSQRQAQPQPQFNPQPQFQPNPWQGQPQAPPPIFGPKAKDDILTVGDAEGAMQDVMGALGATWQQLQTMQRENAMLRQATASQTKQAAGISQLDELRLAAKYPALQSMPDDGNKVGLMKTLLDNERRVSAPPQTPTTPPTVTATTQKIVRNLTHTETNGGQAGHAEQNVSAIFAQEMEKVKALPFHLRAPAMEKLAAAFKIPTVTALGTGGFRR